LWRAAFYRSLERQVVAVGRIHTNQLPPLGELPPPQPRAVHHDPVTHLAICLRQAIAMTVAAGGNTRAESPTTVPVTVALREAAQALREAGDILASNTGPHTHPAAAHQPLTSEGMAIVAGVGIAHNLAALAQLAAAAAAIDKQLTRWLHTDSAPGDLEPLLEAAKHDAARTSSGALASIARLIVSAGLPANAPALGMTVAPPVDDPRRWYRPASSADCVDAIDAARSWLTRQGNRLTIGQLAATAGAALAITHHIGHIYASTETEFAFTGEDTAAALPWRTVLSAAADLRSPTPPAADYTTLRVAVTGVAAWLRQQVRPEGHWLDPISWAPGAAAKSVWRRHAQRLAARLPDLADLLHDSIDAVRERGGVLAPTGQLGQRPGLLVRVPQWAPVTPDDPSYRSVLTGLRRAATNGRAFAVALGIQPRPGLADVRRERPVIPTAARLARLWYPPSAAAAEPTTPSTGAASERMTNQQPRRTFPAANQPRRRR
jgi:hypothetical protein